MPTTADMLRQWSQLHDGYDVERSRVVRAWLLFVHTIAAPLARRRVPPTAVTTLGVVVAAAAVITPRPLAAALVVVTAVCDGVDGAVALQRGLAGRRRGTSIDHAADRVTDVLFATALWHAGAALPVAAAAAAATLGYEALRSGLRRLHPQVSVITVAERPFRVVVVAVGLVAAPLVAAAAIVVATVVASVSLTRVGHRHRDDVAMTRGAHDGSHQLEEDNDAAST